MTAKTMPLDPATLTAQLHAAIDRYLACLHQERAAPPPREDGPQLDELVGWLQQLKTAVDPRDRDGLLSAYAKIRRAIDDGAFDTLQPTRAYVAFDRAWIRWERLVLYSVDA